MLIEQIIKFELSEPGPGRLCTRRKTGYFYDKTTISKANLGVNYYLLAAKNIAGGIASCFTLPGPSHLQNLTKKCKILNVFWT